jgi:hypothetical protein
MTLFDPGHVGAAYRGMLPWSAATGLIALALPGPAGQQLFLVIGASPFLLAAAVRGLGLHNGWNVLALAVHRAFTHLTSLLVLVALTALAAAVGGTAGGMIADLAGIQDDRVLSIPLAGIAALPILWRRWPAAVLAYTVPASAGLQAPGRRAWRGPRYSDAAPLSRAAGRARQTAILLALFFLWTTLLLTAGDHGGALPLDRIVEAASYLVFLPLLGAMAVVEALRMLSAVDRP